MHHLIKFDIVPLPALLIRSCFLRNAHSAFRQKKQSITSHCTWHTGKL